MGSISYIMEGFEKFLPNEYFYAFCYQEIRSLQADITLCLENAETGEIWELWFKQINPDTEEEVSNKEFKKFFNEHYQSLKGRKHADNVLDNLLIAERWIPDYEHKQEHLALYRRMEKHGHRKIAMVVLILEDLNSAGQRELGIRPQR